MPPLNVSPAAQDRNLRIIGYLSYALIAVLVVGFCLGVLYAFARTAFNFLF